MNHLVGAFSVSSYMNYCKICAQNIAKELAAVNKITKEIKLLSTTKNIIIRFFKQTIPVVVQNQITPVGGCKISHMFFTYPTSPSPTCGVAKAVNSCKGAAQLGLVCPRGGGNWGTLRISRENWGTLGNIRGITQKQVVCL